MANLVAILNDEVISDNQSSNMVNGPGHMKKVVIMCNFEDVIMFYL